MWSWLGLSGLLLATGGCSTDFDVTAPEKDIWVLYGVLSPEDTVQYIRVAQGFLPESDAFDYARDTALSLSGLQVILSGGNRVWAATEVDSVLKQPEDGTFYPYQSLYRLRTIGSTRLQPDTRYEVTVTRPGDEEFRLTASTLIPARPRFFSLNPTPGQGRERCLQQVNLEANYTLTFDSEQAKAFELRVYLDYLADGEARQAVYGPTSMFQDDVGCSRLNQICYRFGQQEVLRSFIRQVDLQPNVSYTYAINDDTRCNSDIEDLPNAFRFEITSIDEQLFNYRQVNSAGFNNLNTVRPEYTNVSGPEGSITLGLLGSYSTASASARLSDCSEFLLSLNNRTRPSGTCELQ